MTDLDDLDLFDAPAEPRPGTAPARKCKRHAWGPTGYERIFHPVVDGVAVLSDGRQVTSTSQVVVEPVVSAISCLRCGRLKDHAASRRGRSNRKRGVSDELAVARILGGRKVGPLGHPWDVELPGYARIQCKKLSRWPSLNEVVAWLDAIPAGPELRAVTLADAPGHGRVRRLIVMDLEEYARWHAMTSNQRETIR